MIFPNQKEHIKFHTKLKQFGWTEPLKRQVRERWKEFEVNIKSNNSICKDCGFKMPARSKDVWSKKFIESGLCFNCFRILESEQDPESTKYLDIEKLKKNRELRRKTMIKNPKIIKQLNIFLDAGYKKEGFYGRDKKIIYLKRGNEVSVPFDISDSTFNENALKLL